MSISISRLPYSRTAELIKSRVISVFNFSLELLKSFWPQNAPNHGMTKAFSYLRVSGEAQLDGDGFPRQQAAIKAHAKQHGYRIVRTFREEAVPGAKETMDRPAWQEMMAALHSNGVKTIIIEKLDRLALSLLVQEAAIAELAKQGFTLVSVCEPELMSDDPWRKAFRQMMGVFSELDKNQIVLKLRAARMRKRAATGRCEGRKPYGFREGEQQVVARMKRWRQEGMGLNRIADQLNTEEVPTRSGGRWHPFTVSKILSRAGAAGR